MKSLSQTIRYLLFIVTMWTITSAAPPSWAKDAIWYQIFPERFYNGDPSNDPTISSLWGTWPWETQTDWNITPWTSDWYHFQPWEEANGHPFNWQFQLRRYGGDLQGIIDKLDYLDSLGINAIYLNPVFDSPSSHKYGAAYYHHIDRYFGPNPAEDTRRLKQENPADPSTWVWTTADSLFLELVRKVHEHGMHIIIDGVFNHVGIPFWAFQDVIANREKSPYYSWFNIEGSGLPDKSELNQYQSLPDYFLEPGQKPFRYTGYVADLPAFRQDESGPVPPVREHLHAVVRRWMDPNGDGDPSDGIDGWRLDVAERLQPEFWAIFNGWVQEENPKAYLTGEIWWKDFTHNVQFNAAPWISDEKLDAVMNYRFTAAMVAFFVDEKMAISPKDLDKKLAQVRSDYGLESSYVLQNLLDSHDMERIASATVNPDRWIDHANNLQYNLEFDIRKPNATERKKQTAMVAFQFTYLGAPYIYYGDEAGIWGADDPDCRKPMIWPEFRYDDEAAHPCDRIPDCNYTRPRDPVYFDHMLWRTYHELIQLRKDHSALRDGRYKTVFAEGTGDIFAFTRQDNQEAILAVFNRGDQKQLIPWDTLPDNANTWQQIYGTSNSMQIDGHSAKIFVHR